MDYELGMQLLLKLLQQNHNDAYIEALTFQQRLTENIHRERLFGSSETDRSERARIISALNRLSLTTLQITFNELCLGKLPMEGSNSTNDANFDRLISDIREAYAIVREYENVMTNAFDPRERVRAQQSVDEQWEFIGKYLLELRQLAAKSKQSVPTDIEQIASRSPKVNSTFDLVRLRQILTDRFSFGEIKVLCFDMGIDYDVLSGDSKVEKIISLLQYMQRRSRIDELTKYIKQSRPDVI